ncbi:Hint domain-containing protein [Aliiroseovarius lamellibrachiae]|uniref:Hint domain-containing protein n=1 Tax=Aliiroseovarius lamellibrachiae TaxID=1924933 RepID=UPI001BDFC6BA|nr:Hint domain-containing protein [Aliiroseovarius lamellibrachiae]MBT2130199.1 Hint domain-containing protein [Aliiroseovarius lamellibrachiae]
MSVHYLYVYSPSDFVGGVPNEQNGAALGTPTFTLTLKPGATPTLIAIEDDEGTFQEVNDSQSLVADVTIGGTTYGAGTDVHAAYDLINSGSGLKVTTLHFGGDGYQQGAVQGLASTAPLVAGQSYSFNVERSSYRQGNQYNEYVACFARGTLIETPTGRVNIEDLQIGDLVTTHDHGAQALRWVAHRTVPAQGNFAPVVLPKGAIGNDRDLVLSAQHRVLLSGPRAELLFGETEVMAPALYLADIGLGFRKPGGEVTYYHLMFDRHEVIYSEGVATESYLPGDSAGLSEDARCEFGALFPEFATTGFADYVTARRVLRKHEAALLLTPSH